MFFQRPLADITDRLWIDVDGINQTASTDSSRGPNAKPARPGSNIGNCLLWRNAEDVHYAVDLQPLIAAGRIENGKVSRIWFAGLALWGRRGDGALGRALSKHGPDVREKTNGEQDNAKAQHGWLHLGP